METTAFLFLVFLSIITEGLAIQCYVCSWSPEDQNNSTDTCSKDNFKPSLSYVHTCEDGCETFVQYDTNERLEQWRRNCFQKNHAPLTGDCKQQTTIAWRRVICTCDVDLCNSAISGTNSTILQSLLMIILAALVRNKSI